MKIKQDPETGKLLFAFENGEEQNSFAHAAEDYVDGLADIISNNIGPDVIHLREDQERLISIVRQQQATIIALVKMVDCLVGESEESLQYQLKTVSKSRKELIAEFNKLQAK